MGHNNYAGPIMLSGGQSFQLCFGRLWVNIGRNDENRSLLQHPIAAALLNCPVNDIAATGNIVKVHTEMANA